MDWIDVEYEKPISDFQVVLITDGILTCLAMWIADPVSYYGKDLMEWDENLQDEIPLEKEWHESHWLFETSVGPFIGSQQCFGSMQEITHWMHLPKPP